MKKLTAIMLALMMVMVLVPGAVLADPTTKTIDVSALTKANGYNTYSGAVNGDYSLYSDHTAGVIFSYSMSGDLFQNTIFTNTNYDSATGYGVCKITIYSGAETLNLTNLTFAPGIVLDIQIGSGSTTNIVGCTFNGPNEDPANQHLYTITIHGGTMNIQNCVFNKVYRGMNVLPRISPYVLTATGNTFDLEPLAGSGAVDNLGIQLSGDGGKWPANSVTLNNNTFINAQIALRLHTSFKAADDIGAQQIITFSGNTLINTPTGVGAHQSATGATLTYLQGILATNVTETGTNTGTVVTAGVDPTFTITIPAAVDFGKVAKGTDDVVRDFVVSASGVVIETNKQINVSVTSDFLLSGGGTTLAYRLYNNDAADATVIGTGGLFASFTENGNKDGNVKLDRSQITVAAAYQDTMVFTIAYVNKP